VLEYEEILTRELVSSTYSSDEISSFLDDFVASGIRHASITTLRPVSIDPDDDALIELAVTAAADTIVTFNTRHLKFAYAHGINLLTPGDFLRKMNL
jgi:predicted nucleic acid-binding protein